MTAELAPLRETLASVVTQRDASAERAERAEREATETNSRVERLLSEKASMFEELGTLKGERSAADAQLDAARRAAEEHEREKTSMTEDANRLHADYARTRANATRRRNNSRRRARTPAARASAADASVAVAESRAAAARLEDAAERAAADVARAAAETESLAKRLDAAEAETRRLAPALAAAEDRAANLERDAAAARRAHEKETAALRCELDAARAHRAALEPRVESLGAELAEARADAKVARAESEHLRRAGDEARERGAGADRDRAEAARRAEELRDAVAKLETELASERTKRENAEAATAAAEASAANEASNAEAAAARLADAESVAADAAAPVRVSTRSARRTTNSRGRWPEKLADAAANVVARTRLREREAAANSAAERVAALEAKLARREAELRQAATVRRALHNAVMEAKGNIRVFCRVRPPKPGEDPRVGAVGGGKDGDQPLLRPATRGEWAGRRLEVAPPGGSKSFEFTFDRVFGQTAGQREVFEEISHLVRSALDGYKVCIFTYGQTGSGKTYTMLGGEGGETEAKEGASDVSSEDSSDDSARGLIPRTIQQIFEARDAAAREAEERADRGANPPELRVTATMMEIYNEDIKDLLGGSSSVKHDVKHDKRGDTTVTGLRSARVESAAEVDALMKRAQAARTTASTLMNDHSSRSHMVLTLALDGVRASGRPVKGALNLVDLAGSERLSRTGATGDRLKEAQSINKSLSALGDVIFALAHKESHVPFRNSKLTYLLQNALGGDAKTLMFVNVAPDAASSQETLCSLRFAAKVNNCALGKNGEK